MTFMNELNAVFLLQNYLEKYGYYGKNTNNKNVFTSQLTISDAIKEFQKFAGLNETGMDNLNRVLNKSSCLTARCLAIDYCRTRAYSSK